MVPCGPILARWELLRTGGIDAGLQGAPLDYIALDQGFVSLANPREEVPDFQFTSLDIDAGRAAANRDLLLRFLRAFLRARLVLREQGSSNAIAVRESGIEERYADRACSGQGPRASG